MQPVDRIGQFRAEITEYGINQADSGAIGISIKAKLTEWWDGENWQPWTEYQQEAEGSVWVVKKDGKINENGAESLMRHAGWDGSLESIAGETWQPTPCQVAIAIDEYKGQKRFRINFVNDWTRTPGAMSNVSVAKAAELQARYGASLRAIGGNIKRNVGASTAGKPVAPPPSAKPPTPPPPPPGAPLVEGEQIPF